MRLVILCFVFMLLGSASVENDSLTPEDYELAERYGYKKKRLENDHKIIQETFNSKEIIDDIVQAFENDPFKSAVLVDQAIDNMFQWAFVLLRAEGRTDVADKIEFEYITVYKDYFQRDILGILEIGDHPPMNEWLKTAHKKIHDTIGDFICKQTHVHDIYILNHSIPVVFSPKSYNLKDYLDHFAGHLIWGWWWEHHGFAGVVTYWTVNGACVGMTYGLGVLPFVCGPVATLAEEIMDKRIAPDMGERIWQRAQKGK